MPTDAPRIARRQPLLQFEVKRPAAREREQQIRYRDRRLLDLARVHGVLIAPAVLDDSHEARILLEQDDPGPDEAVIWQMPREGVEAIVPCREIEHHPSPIRSEEPHTELQYLMPISSAVFCLQKKTKDT